jgi:pathogenesis-related protein 1
MVGITAAHNVVRARIMNPAPSPALPPLTWSTDLAKTAQAYADKLASGGNCLNLVHSMAPGLGENLAGYQGKAATTTEVVEGWAGEEACYTFGKFMSDDKCDMTCTTQQHSNGCGHYTQVVWRNTTQVGCGMGMCGTGRSAGEVWVCNYKAPGNYVGQKAY